MRAFPAPGKGALGVVQSIDADAANATAAAAEDDDYDGVEEAVRPQVDYSAETELIEDATAPPYPAPLPALTPAQLLQCAPPAPPFPGRPFSTSPHSHCSADTC